METMETVGTVETVGTISTGSDQVKFEIDNTKNKYVIYLSNNGKQIISYNDETIKKLQCFNGKNGSN